MTAQIAAYGRLGGDPVARQSKTGTTWATASIAVQLGGGDQADAPPQWFSVVAFGKAAEILCRHSKGDLVSVSGRLQLNRWRDREGNEREQLQVIVNSIISARTVRPPGARRQDVRSAAA